MVQVTSVQDKFMQVPPKTGSQQKTSVGSNGSGNSQAQNSNNSNSSSQQEMEPRKKRSLWWLWLLIGLIVGAGLSAAYFLFLK